MNKCKERIREHYRGRIETIRRLWALYGQDCEAQDENGEMWTEYGLSLDYVVPGTFRDQRRGYLRFQLSWGGPSDEFRFYMDERQEPTRIEYWFLDWFDGAHIVVSGRDRALMEEIFADWQDCETVSAKIAEATA